MSSKDTRTPEQIERDIVDSRTRLAATVDELAYRAKPQTIAKRQAESAKRSARSVVYRPDGQLRVELLAPVAIAVIGLTAVALINRARRG